MQEEPSKQLKQLNLADLLAAISQGRKFESLATYVGIYWERDVREDAEKGAPDILRQADSVVHMGAVFLESPIEGERPLPQNAFTLIRWIEKSAE